jgi:hypothetical protein
MGASFRAEMAIGREERGWIPNRDVTISASSARVVEESFSLVGVTRWWREGARTSNYV